MDIDLKVSLKELQEGPAKKVIANLTYQRQGKTWGTIVTGQGQNRADAVEALVKGNMPERLKAAFMGRLAEEDSKEEPERGQSPKAQMPPDFSASDGEQEKPRAQQQNDTPKPQTSSQPQVSPSKETKDAESLPPKTNPVTSPSPKSSEKPAGTIPESQSDQEAQGKPGGIGGKKKPEPF